MVWEYGKEASDGLEQVAEWGSTRTLESELKRQVRAGEGEGGGGLGEGGGYERLET